MVAVGASRHSPPCSCSSWRRSVLTCSTPRRTTPMPPSPPPGHRETWPVRARPFRLWLSRLFYERHGKVPGSQAIQDAVGALEGKALFDGKERPTPVRVAEHEGAIWL